MNDRDKFAAAALTGLLSNIPRYQLGVIAVQAYDIADEMLRERLRNGAVKGCETVQSDRPSGVSSAWADAARQQMRERGHYGSSFPYVQGPRSTNHDAVPEAKANADGEPAPKCGGEAGLSSRDGTGNTLTLSESEREAIREGADALYGDGYDAEAATLRKLLERLK